MARLLIVDDNVPLLELLQHILSEEGYEVDCAASADHASALMAGRTPDLVVTDINMPGTNGIEFAERLRTSHPGLPIVAHSATLPVERTDLFDGLLPKPAGLDEIRRVLVHLPASLQESADTVSSAP